MINKRADTHMGDILIVDDDLPSLSTLSSMLTTEGYEVRGVPDGQTALTVIENNSPDLILLDVKMPGMNGFEVCRQIKADKKSSGIPILFLTALDEMEDKAKGFTVGAVDFITKPFQTEEVLARVETHTTLYRLSKKLEEQAGEHAAEFKDSEERYRSLVEAAPVSIMAIRNGCILFANPAGARMLGFSDPDKMGGIPALDIVAPESQQLVTERIKRLESGKDNPTSEIALIRQDGIQITVESKSVSIHLDGIPTAVIISQDTSERRELKSKLRESEERFRAFMDNNPAVSYIKNESGQHLYGNRTLFDKFEISPDKFIGTTTKDFFPRALAEKIEAHDEEVITEGVAVETDDWSDKWQGQVRWWKEIKFPVKLPSGDLLVGGIAFDITARRRAEEALSEQLEFERLIADIASRLAQTEREQLKDAIDSTLQALGRFLHTERSFFAEFSDDGNRLVFTNTWAAEGFSSLSQIFKMDMASEIPWVAQRIRSGEVINAGAGLNGLPDEAQKLRSQLERDGVNSGVVVPVRVQGKPIGMLGMDTIVQPREYSQSIVDRLKIVADMIGTALLRIRAEKINDEQLKFEDLISKLSATFIHIKASEIDKNIESGLQLIVEFLDFERGNLFQFSPDKKSLILTHSFAKKGVKTFPGILFSDQHPWFTKKLLRKESICFSHSTGLPEEATAEKEYIRQHGIKSAFIIPLEAADVAHGGITLSSLKRERKWPDKLVQKFKILSEVFSNALLRKRADEKIEEALTEIKQLKDHLEQENIYLRQEIEVNYKHEEIVGKSKPVLEMLSRAEQVAETGSTVLILGETGTGKELLARSIHRLSPRQNRQMVKVNCASLPPTLIESELFGREKGAYTGAMTRQIGRFEIADGSTIFLDEIGELPLDMQAKLLRVLQEGQFERLGNPQTISVNVRIIASTNRDLAKAVSEGRFREDLYYRLNVFSITVPPLRDRIEDIPLLVWSVVKEFERGMGKTIEKIPQKSIDMLQLYSWPGNIRELRNVIESAMIISSGKTLNLIPPVDPSLKVQKILKLVDVERNHIIDVLEKSFWRVSGEKGAANLLGLKPTTLESRMKKLGIVRPR